MKKMYDDERIKEIASEAGGKKLYKHDIYFTRADDVTGNRVYITIFTNTADKITTVEKLRNAVGAGYKYFPVSGFWKYSLIVGVSELSFNTSNVLTLTGIKGDATTTTVVITTNISNDRVTEIL